MSKDILLKKIDKAYTEYKLLKDSFNNIISFLDTENLPVWMENSIETLVEEGQWKELNNRFYKAIEFGTAGMRGRTIGGISTPAEKDGEHYIHAAVGTACMNDLNIVRATMGLFNYCKLYLETDCEFAKRPSLVIAYDTRYFSKHFCELTASTWSQLGGDIYIFDGPRSTPQLSFSVRYLKTTAGVMITASHNPFFDNGYKVYFEDGAQINEKHALGITKCIQKISYTEALRYSSKDFRGVHHLSSLIDEAYLDCCEDSLVDGNMFKRLKTTKIVYTPLHGTGSVCILPLFKNLGWNLLTLDSQMSMDGGFPTVKSPNPDNLETLQLALEEAKKTNADAVIATDPDGDRMSAMLKDGKGQWQLLNGNTIAVLLAEYRLNAMKALDLLPKKRKNIAIIKSFVTTPLLKSFAEANGFKLIETHTGFKWIGEKLKDYEETFTKNFFRLQGLKLDYSRCSYAARKELMSKNSSFFFLGAEESCGFLANDAVRDKDANAATLMFAEFVAYLKAHELSYSDFLDEIYLKYGYFKEDLLSFTFDGAEGVNKIKRLMDLYRSKTTKRYNNVRVLTTTDFLSGGGKDADGKEIPASDFIIIRLLDGCSIAIRPSGTEPKLKMYLFAQTNVEKGENLNEIKSIISERLTSLKAWLQKDVSERLK